MFSKLLYLKVDKLDESGKVIRTLPFPSASDQIVLGTYTYEAKRMGGTPTITDSFYFPRCLNDEWNRDGYSEVYAEYENEKFCVTSVPSSTKDNSTLLFKHEITLASRREILDNTLFFDAVAKDSDMFSVDKYRSNQTSFSFSGTIYEFVDRINSSLAYIGVYNPKAKDENSKGYHVEITEGYGTDDIKELSFSDQYITDVLQKIYNTFGLTYYWKGNTCYVGKCENDLTDENNIIKYGVNDALISVNEENTNNKIIDMVTGYGSSDNIPFYYPNDDEFGKAIYKTSLIEESQVTIALSKLQKNVGGDYTKTYQFCKRVGDTTGIIPITQLNTPFNGLVIKSGESFVRIKTFVINAKAGTKIHEAEIKTSHTTIDSVTIKSDTFESYIEVLKKTDNKYEGNRTDWNGKYNGVYECVEAGLYLVTLRETITVVSKTGISISVDNAINYNYQGSLKVDYQNQSEYYWKYDKGTIEYENSGIEVVVPSITPFAKSVVTFVTKNDPSVTVYTYYEFSEVIDTTTEADAAKVYISGREWIMPTNKLMPSVYRNTGGAQRFYFAIENPSEEYRDIYLNPNTNKQYEFKNKYKDANPHQGSTSFDDIKPTIRDIRNDVIQTDGLGQLFGEIADVAFDSTDSDVKDRDGNYVHQYFYIKLHKFSGEFGFNLFSSALEEEAKIEMIDCQGCPACSFPIRVIWNAAKNKCYNCVSVDKDGNLNSLRTDANDYILSDTEAQLDTLNQNTMLSEVWIAVQKDASTLGVVMPNVNGNFKPQRGDKFVITGINPPKVLTLAAEKRLDKALIKYMSENNEDKFNYSVKFSRIYLAEHPNFAQKLNENAKVCLEYNGVRHELFVNNYSVKRDGKILAEVNVELTESIEPTQSDIKQIIDSVKNSISFETSGGLGKFNASITDKLYLSKLKDDTAQGFITFLKGLKSQDVIKAINGLSLGNGENYVNGNGYANLSDVIVDRIHDKNSTPSDRTIIGAQGFDLYMGDDGKSHLYVDYLTARTRMFASSVEIRKVSYSGGTTIFSNAGSQIAKVSYIYDAAKEKVIAYKCYAAADDGTTKTMNWWHVGMMALCQTFNVKAGENNKLDNRYYWRLVVGVGQEKIEGKLYDYVILSNVKEFQGNLLTVPSFADKTLANEQSKKLVWGNVMVEVTMDKGMQTLASLFAEQEGKDVDDNGNKIADRIFYGYDGDEEPDAPAPFDVIVQVGDQIQWKKYGNVIKLSTSTEDSATDNAPAITMYHKLGAPHYTGSLDANGNKIINPYQWKIITTIISPEKVMHNTDNFQLFQGTPDNIVDPITIMYDIVPSVAYYTRHPSTQTTTPTDITFSLRKRTGNKIETLDDAQIYAEYTLLNGNSATKLLSNKALSDIGNLYQITSVKIKSTIKEADHEDIVVTLDLPVLTDGVKGDQGAAGKDGTNGIDGKDGKTPAVVSTIYQYAITTTSAKPADSEWKSVMPDPSKYEGKFLWTKTTTTWSTGDKTDTFSCTYIGTDGANGTSVTIKGTFGSISELPTTGTAGDGYIIGGFLWIYTGTTTEDANNHNGYTNVGKIKGEDGKNATQYYIHTAWMKASDGTGFTVANPNGDAYPYVGTLVDVNENDSTNWRDYKWTYVKGATGAKGDKGADGVDGADGRDGLDALEVTIKNAPLVFDTDDNGVVKPSTIQVAEIWARRDGENVIADIKNAKIIDSLNFNVGSENAIIRKTSECLQVSLKGIGIAKESVNGSDVSKTGGYVVVSFDDGTNPFSRQIAFSVNVSRFNSSVIQTAKLYERKYTEVSNKYDALPEEVRDKASFTEYNSSIKQTAREISLSLTEQAVSRRNLLVNSDFARNGGFALSTPSKATVERLSGYEGSNCIHTISSTTSFPALRWEGYTSKTNNIPIVGGKKYTISCWVKVSNTNAPLYVKVFGQNAITGNVETNTAATGTIFDKVEPLNSANTWQLVSFTFVASGGYSYCSVRLFFRPPSTTLIDGYICRPMLEQSDSYNGWTLSEEDYNYQGGNMLDNTRYLNTGGNLSQVGILTGNAKDGCSLREATVQQNKSATLVRFDNVSVVANTDYMLSFFIRSKFLSSKTNVVCTLNLVTNAKFAECSNGSVSSYTSANGNSTTSGYIEFGNIPTEWTKVWYHFSAQTTVTNQTIAIQIYGRNGAGTLQVCQPKLEAGLMNTSWTEATEDVANKDALKRTGIDIEKGKITLDADNTVITGDLHLRGILVENYEDLSANNDLFIVCDMKAHKSVTVSHSRVILPMLDTHTIKDYNDKEYAVNGLKEAGVKLTIASKYNSYVAKWAQTTPSLFESYKNFDNRGLMKTYHNYASVVFADPRIADKGNYKIVEGIDTLVPTILPEGGGGYAATGYEGGVFVCNGRRGRALVLMPGQTLHLTSAIEYVNEKQVLIWYVDNSSDFTPLTKEVCFYSWDGYTYDHGFHSNGGNAFPMEVSGSSGSEYEDAIFGTKILDETNLNSSLHAYWGGFLTGYSD